MRGIYAKIAAWMPGKSDTVCSELDHGGLGGYKPPIRR